MVNIVHVAFAIAQFDQRLDTGNDVFFAQGALGIFGIQSQTHIHFDPANSRKIIAFAVEEQGIEQCRSCLNSRGLAWPHDAIDIHKRGFAAHVFILRHGIAHIGANVDIVDVQYRNIGKACINQLFERSTSDFTLFVIFQRQFIAGFDIDCAVFFVDDILRNKLADNLLKRKQQFGHLAFVD